MILWINTSIEVKKLEVIYNIDAINTLLKIKYLGVIHSLKNKIKNNNYYKFKLNKE